MLIDTTSRKTSAIKDNQDAHNNVKASPQEAPQRRICCIRLNEDNILLSCKIVTIIVGIASIFVAKRYLPD